MYCKHGLIAQKHVSESLGQTGSKPSCHGQGGHSVGHFLKGPDYLEPHM